MMGEVRLLTLLELRGLLGLNKLRHTHDRKQRARMLLVGAAFVLLALMAAAYTCGLVYGLHILGLGQLAPAYLSMVCALLVLLFGVTKAGSLLFAKGGYEMLCALPLRTGAIVAARFLSMYLFDLALTLLVLLPGTVTYGVLLRPGAGFYVVMALGALLLPLLPLAIASALGTLIYGLAARMKRKNLAQVALSLALLLVILPLSFTLGLKSEDMTAGMFADLASTVGQLMGRLYPPALWLGQAAAGSLGALLKLAALSLGSAAAVVALTARLFHPICRRLFVTTAKKDYQLTGQKGGSLGLALYKRELRAYFSSSVYVMNTLVGPIMAVLLAAALAFGGDLFTSDLPPQLDLQGLIPFVLAATLTMMPTTAVALSMEGKHFWAVKCLPIPTKALLDAKLLTYLTLALPGYGLAEGLLFYALCPSGTDALWLALIPLLLVLFAGVFGLTVDLRFCTFDWEKAESVVKQSISAMGGGFATPLVTVVHGAVALLSPPAAKDLLLAGLCLVTAAATALLYRRNNKAQLETL